MHLLSLFEPVTPSHQHIEVGSKEQNLWASYRLENRTSMHGNVLLGCILCSIVQDASGLRGDVCHGCTSQDAGGQGQQIGHQRYTAAAAALGCSMEGIHCEQRLPTLPLSMRMQGRCGCGVDAQLGMQDCSGAE